MMRGGAFVGTCGGGVCICGWVDLGTTWVGFLRIPCNFCAYWRRLSNCCTALDVDCVGYVGGGCAIGVCTIGVLVERLACAVTCIFVISVSLFSFIIGVVVVYGCFARSLIWLRASSNSI
jgi:hypothetical protein